MISNIPGKASRMLVESRGLPSDSTSVLETKPCKLDIKILESGIWRILGERLLISNIPGKVSRRLVES